MQAQERSSQAMGKIELCIQDKNQRHNSTHRKVQHLSQTRTSGKGPQGHSATVGHRTIQSICCQYQTVDKDQVATQTEFK